jgi:hypothetical protein
MAGGDNNSQTTNGGSGHEQRAMEEGRKQEEFAADGQGCGLAFSVPFIQKVIIISCLLLPPDLESS